MANKLPRYLLLVCLPALGTLRAAPVDYLRDIKPLLADKCYACHGALKAEAGLRVDTKAVLAAGGDSGPALVAGHPDDSLFFQRVSASHADHRMPPEGEGERLDKKQLALVRQWITEGAQAPDEPLPPDPRQHWAFSPPSRPAIPLSHHTGEQSAWPQSPLDALIAVQHAQHRLAPTAPAADNILLRRVYLDLIGLPPSPDELQAFLADKSPDAYERVIDRLLAQPQYGQRWGRHWMDVWRYSDWAGYKQEVRESQRHIWRWRDWIIESLNHDKGYDQMVVEMLAGDEIAPGDRAVLRATGFLVRNRHNSNRNIWLDATVEHTAKAFLGLTINCARCHDHKYDPVPQSAYYALRAVFEPHDVAIERLPGQSDLLKEGFVRVFDSKLTEPTYLYRRGDEKQPDKDHPILPGLPDVLAGQLVVEPVSIPLAARTPLLQPEFRDEDISAANKALEQATSALEKARAAITGEATEAEQQACALAEAKLAVAHADLASIAARWEADFARGSANPPPTAEDLAQEAARAERSASVAKSQLALLQAQQALTKAQAAEKPDEAKAKAALTKAEKDLKTAEESLAKARTEAEKTDSVYTPVAKSYPETSSGRRLALARWIANPANPLAPRVAVNHLWLRHFGAPLVDNVFDFGLRTPRPPLGDVLDWLAVELTSRDFSMKHLHRQLVASRVYRLDSSVAAASPAAPLDPDNRLLWRANTRRLEAELVRDGMLYLGGSLDLASGGPEVDQQLGETSRRRSVYIRHAYEKQMKFLMLFDAANVNECYRRSESIIPQQALAAANSTLSFAQARLLARELTASLAASASQADDSRFITAAFERVLTRSPSPPELELCQQFLVQQAKRLADPAALTPFTAGDKPTVAPSAVPADRARENLIHVLLNHNDFVTIR